MNGCFNLLCIYTQVQIYYEIMSLTMMLISLSLLTGSFTKKNDLLRASCSLFLGGLLLLFVLGFTKVSSLSYVLGLAHNYSLRKHSA